MQLEEMVRVDSTLVSERVFKLGAVLKYDEELSVPHHIISKTDVKIIKS